MQDLTVKQIVYGIDIGVVHWEEPQKDVAPSIDPDTTFAWARMECPLGIEEPLNGWDPSDGGIEIRTLEKAGDPASPVPVGRCPGALVNRLVKDLKAKSKVALGVEAPMWYPYPDSFGQCAGKLFSKRFDEETAHYAWYSGVAAAATAKARSIIGSIMDALHSKGLKHLVLVDRVSKWTARKKGKPVLMVWEGFAAGKEGSLEDSPCSFKCRHPSGITQDEWDAFCIAAAFFAETKGPAIDHPNVLNDGDIVRSKTLARSISKKNDPSDGHSVWREIAHWHKWIRSKKLSKRCGVYGIERIRPAP